MCDGDGVLFLHHSVLKGFTTHTVFCPINNGSTSDGSKSGRRVILITHSRSTLTFGKKGIMPKLPVTAGPSFNFNSLETQIKGGDLTFHCHRMPSDRTRTARPTDISKTEEFCCTPGDTRRKRVYVKWHGLWVVFGCTRFTVGRDSDYLRVVVVLLTS